MECSRPVDWYDLWLKLINVDFVKKLKRLIIYIFIFARFSILKTNSIYALVMDTSKDDFLVNNIFIF